MAKISVIMPVHNGESFIREAIDSCLRQSFTDFELIIINDGSTDSTKSIIHDYRDIRIRYIENKNNIGITKSLNRGLKDARADYIARIDADDIFLSEKLEKQYKYLLSNEDVVLAGSWSDYIDEEGKYLSTWKTAENYNTIKYSLLFGTPMAHSSIVFKKSVILDIGKYDERYQFAQDLDLYSRLVGRFKISNIPVKLVKIRSHKKRVSQSGNRIEQDRCAKEIRCRNIKKYVDESDDIIKLYDSVMHGQKLKFIKIGKLLTIHDSIFANFRAQELNNETIDKNLINLARSKKQIILSQNNQSICRLLKYFIK